MCTIHTICVLYIPGVHVCMYYVRATSLRLNSNVYVYVNVLCPHSSFFTLRNAYEHLLIPLYCHSCNDTGADEHLIGSFPLNFTPLSTFPNSVIFFSVAQLVSCLSV